MPRSKSWQDRNRSNLKIIGAVRMRMKAYTRECLVNLPKYLFLVWTYRVDPKYLIHQELDLSKRFTFPFWKLFLECGLEPSYSPLPGICLQIRSDRFVGRHGRRCDDVDRRHNHLSLMPVHHILDNCSSIVIMIAHGTSSLS